MRRESGVNEEGLVEIRGELSVVLLKIEYGRLADSLVMIFNVRNHVEGKVLELRGKAKKRH